eukprot:520344-Rhodomonas_salina.1
MTIGSAGPSSSIIPTARCPLFHEAESDEDDGEEEEEARRRLAETAHALFHAWEHDERCHYRRCSSKSVARERGCYLLVRQL